MKTTVRIQGPRSQIGWVAVLKVAVVPVIVLALSRLAELGALEHRIALDYRPPAPGACNPFLPPKPISQPLTVI